MSELGCVPRGWSPEEDSRLARLVADHGEGNWSKVSELIGGRTGKQCRERWLNHVRPGINFAGWTDEEEAMLVRAHMEHGNRWKDIAKAIPGRTENQVKNHVHKTLRRIRRGSHDEGGLHTLAEYLSRSVPGLSQRPARPGASGGSGKQRRPREPREPSRSQSPRRGRSRARKGCSRRRTCSLDTDAAPRQDAYGDPQDSHAHAQAWPHALHQHRPRGALGAQDARPDVSTPSLVDSSVWGLSGDVDDGCVEDLLGPLGLFGDGLGFESRVGQACVKQPAGAAGQLQAGARWSDSSGVGAESWALSGARRPGREARGGPCSPPDRDATVCVALSTPPMSPGVSWDRKAGGVRQGRGGALTRRGSQDASRHECRDRDTTPELDHCSSPTPPTHRDASRHTHVHPCNTAPPCYGAWGREGSAIRDSTHTMACSGTAASSERRQNRPSGHSMALASAPALPPSGSAGSCHKKHGKIRTHADGCNCGLRGACSAPDVAAGAAGHAVGWQEGGSAVGCDAAVGSETGGATGAVWELAGAGSSEWDACRDVAMLHPTWMPGPTCTMQRLCQCEGAGCHSGRGCVGGGSDVACDGAWLPAISPCDLASLEELADIFGQ